MVVLSHRLVVWKGLMSLVSAASLARSQFVAHSLDVVVIKAAGVALIRSIFMVSPIVDLGLQAHVELT